MNALALLPARLRERTEDTPLLVRRFVEDFSKAFGKGVESIAKDNIEVLRLGSITASCGSPSRA